MSGTKRKRYTPQQLCEEKRSKMTWGMRDLMKNKQDDCLWEPLDINSACTTTIELNEDRICRSLRKDKKHEVQSCIELNLDNTYPAQWYCNLGSFHIFLSSNKSKANGDFIEISPSYGINRERLESSGVEASNSGSGDFTDIVVTLSFETKNCSAAMTDLCNEDPVRERDCLKGLKFKAFVPSTIEDNVNALVYLQRKEMISLVLKPEYPMLTECWEVAVCLNECGLTKLSFPSEETSIRKADKMIKIVMSWFFNKFQESLHFQDCEVPVLDKGFDDVYAAVKLIQQTGCSCVTKTSDKGFAKSSSGSSLTWNMCDDLVVKTPCKDPEACPRSDFKVLDNIQHPGLKPALRNYQKRAVQWMIRREQCYTSTPLKCKCTERLGSNIHPLWKEVYTLDRKVIYYNPYTGRLTRERFSSPTFPCGGILADEMGLGKTVEVIACILNHPKPSFALSTDQSTAENITLAEYSQDLVNKIAMQEKTSSHKDSASESKKHEQRKIGECICQLSTTHWKENIVDKDSFSGKSCRNCELSFKHSCLADNTNSDVKGRGPTETDNNASLHKGTFTHRKSDHASDSHALKEANLHAIKCHCICGSNYASLSDSVLQCYSCQIVFHASCINHDPNMEFLCPHCVMNKPAVPSRATLIISPAPIAQQWVDEISRHTEVSALKLLVYEGVSKMGFIHPAVLADNDVILTTYSTLRADFYHLGTKQAAGSRSLRYEKRYFSLPSPLTAVYFWRICLDEAQMVESATAKAAEVALHLKCKHRWCVTGTPLQRGLEDIYGLLLFLGVYPYCQQRWWKALLYEPYKNGQKQLLYNLLAKIMWRSAKNDVIDEIQLPKQEEKVKWLTFSPVEHHFYCRQHEECARTTLKMLSSWEKSDTKLKHHRQTHRPPDAYSFAASASSMLPSTGCQRSTLTMDQLLISLIAKAKLECEEAHRQLLFAFNGLAGIHIIKEEWPTAVDLYRDAIRSWTEHQDTFRTDALQKLHTLCNLSDVLSSGHPGCSRTLRDDTLNDEVKKLKQTYMTRVGTQVTVAQQNLNVIKANIAEMLQMYRCVSINALKICDFLPNYYFEYCKVDFKSPWWMLALQSVSTGSLEGELLQRVQDELSSTEMDLGSFQQRFSDLRGLQYVTSSKLDMIMSTHDNLLTSLEGLNVEPSSHMIQTSAECCLRPVKNHNHAMRCQFCSVDDIFTEYESRLFGHQGMKGVQQEVQPDSSLDWHRYGNTGGLRAESEVEKVLKVVFNFIKSHKIIPAVHQEARCHLNIIESLKKEFKFLRALWFALRERVSCLDELDMCSTRLRILLPGEPATDDRHVIHPLQVEQQRLKFVSDRVVAQTELRKKLGQLLYLNNLSKTQTRHDGKNPDPCPVCTRQLGVQWSVFSCGHCVCCQCAWVLLRQSGIGPRQRNVQVKCPMCRIPTLAREISYVSTAGNQMDSTEENVSVKGSLSTKVEAVVRTVLTIKMTDSTAKCLVFSTWQDVLVVIGKALQENAINYSHITGSRHLQTNLQTFKQNPDVCVLLLPLHSGSNGLNIIEATHVLLVEPALNPAHELQAVGRVHRIGQTKPTHVYRFIIRGTVESRMFALLHSKPKTACVRTGTHDNENSSLTLGDLAALFSADWEGEDQTVGAFLQENEAVSQFRTH